MLCVMLKHLWQNKLGLQLHRGSYFYQSYHAGVPSMEKTALVAVSCKYNSKYVSSTRQTKRQRENVSHLC